MSDVLDRLDWNTQAGPHWDTYLLPGGRVLYRASTDDARRHTPYFVARHDAHGGYASITYLDMLEAHCLVLAITQGE